MDKTLKVAVILSAYDKMSTVINSATAKAQQKLKGLEKVQRGLNTFGNAGMLAGGVATAYFASTLGAAEENIVAVNRLEQVYKSMGQNVAEASKQSQDYASKLEMQIGVEDEEIMAVQAKIATFSKVSDATARMSGLMDRATAAAFDLGATGFGEASGNAVMLGKALQDPARGAMALAKAGALNKGDIPIIKQIQATRGLKAAQEFVMRAVEKQVKGVAAATVPATRKMKVGWSEVTESIGKKLQPTVEKFGDYATSTLIPKIQDFIEKHPELVRNVALGSAALLGLGAAAKVVAFSMSGIGSIITGVSTAVKFMGNTISVVSRVMMANPILAIIAAIAIAAFLIYNNWDKIKVFFINLWDKIKAIFIKTWNWIKNMFLNYTPYGLIIKHWDKISAFFINLWNNIKEIFMNHVRWVMGLGAKFFNAGKNIVVSIWEGIKKFVDKPVEAIKKMAEKIRKFLPFSPAKEGALRDIHKIRLVETIAESIKVQPVVQAMNRVGNAVFNSGGYGGGPKLAMAGRGGHSFNINISLNGGATQQDAAMVGREMRKTVLSIIKEENNRVNRTAF